jgi:hypothetical protein
MLALISVLLLAGHAGAGCLPDAIWMNHYGAGEEYLMAVDNVPGGGFIVGGITGTYGAGDSDFWLFKLDANGDTVWTRTYGGTGEDDLMDARAVPGGGYIMCGSTRAYGSSNTDIWVVRTDANGDTLWTWTYGDAVHPEWAGSVQPTASGGFAVAATADTSLPDAQSDIYLYLLDSGGALVGQEYFGGPLDEVAMTIRQTPDGGFIIAGWTRSFGYGAEMYLVKTDALGEKEWEKWYGDTGAEEGRDAIVTADSGYVIVGTTTSFGAGGHDFYIVKTNSAGDTLWTRAVGGTDHDIADGVIEGTDGTIIVLGETESYGPGDMAMLVAAMDGYGSVHCTGTYGTDGLDDGVALVETPDQGVVLAGGTAPSGTFDWSGTVIRIYGQAPIIHNISDVPYDQGRNVRIVWGRSSHDVTDGSPVITGYAIYRKYDWAAASSRGLAEDEFLRLGYPPGDWDYVTTVPARYEDVYSTVVPTLCDSIAGLGICWSFFFVSAVTAEPGFYFDSVPDSGYSVDNLAPSPPANLHMPTASDLAWDETPEEDFDYFTVYGSAGPDFSGAVFIGYTIGTGLDVSSDTYDYYHVTATDFAGNEGDASTVENTFAGVDGIPAAYALGRNQPNPFQASTSVSFDAPVAGRVALEVIDVKGRVVRTLVDDIMPAGRRSAVWDGRDEAGARVGPGVYFMRMSAGEFTANRKVMVLR